MLSLFVLGTGALVLVAWLVLLVVERVRRPVLRARRDEEAGDEHRRRLGVPMRAILLAMQRAKLSAQGADSMV